MLFVCFCNLWFQGVPFSVLNRVTKVRLISIVLPALSSNALSSCTIPVTWLRRLSPSCDACSLAIHLSDLSSETAGPGVLLDLVQAPRSPGWGGSGAGIGPWALMPPRKTWETMIRKHTVQVRQTEIWRKNQRGRIQVQDQDWANLTKGANSMEQWDHRM